MNEEAHVLVVDDDARLRALLSRYLAENGFRVSSASHAAEARDKLRFLAPDALVLDVMMPGETGLALTASAARRECDGAHSAADSARRAGGSDCRIRERG